jgi:hypothetical protein
VNEFFNAGTATQTAYHYTSGAGRDSIVFDLAITSNYTTMFGTYGSSSSNEFVIGSEFAATNFSFKSDLSMPANLPAGTTLMTVQSDGQIVAPLLQQITYNERVLTYDNATGLITYSDLSGGMTGATGAQGPVGSTGSAGASGAKGETGTVGSNGVAGAVGPSNVYTNSIPTWDLSTSTAGGYSTSSFFLNFFLL